MATFKTMIEENKAEIMQYMNWENYDLNDVTMPVLQDLREHSLKVLTNSYGSYEVEPDILDEFCADVFIHFPALMQQLAITRLMDAYGVVKDDIITDQLTREEIRSGISEQNSELTVGTTVTDSNLLDTKQKTTGTVAVEDSETNTQTGNIEIENISGVDMTGSRSVNLSHSMPEQAISGITGDFPKDSEGTPILQTSYIQNANENFNTHNPIDSHETSEQISLTTNSSESDSLTTNDVTVANTGTTTRNVVNSGTDMSESTTTNDETNTVSENRTRSETNKQYAYEIKAFLESVDTINAFERWIDKFSWVVGII